MFVKNNREITFSASKEFEDKNNFLNVLRTLIVRQINSHIVITYRNNGIHSKDDLTEFLRQFHEFEIVEYNLGKYSYSLNKNNDAIREVLFICRNITR